MHQLQYRTEQSIAACVESVMTSPWEYYCEFGTPLWYEVESVSSTSLEIVFRGGQFRRAMKSRYLLVFSQERDGTAIELRFLGGLQYIPSDIDRFMYQKMGALRAGEEEDREKQISKLKKWVL